MEASRSGSRRLYLCLCPGLLAAGLAGCAESEAPRADARQADARFAEATPAQLKRVYSASTGGELAWGLFYGAIFAGRNDTTQCPAIVTTGQDTTVTGDCTSEDGTHAEGMIAIHNLPGTSAYDESEPSSIDFDFRISHQDKHYGFDGRIERDRWGVTGDLVTERHGITSTSRVTVACNDRGTCSTSDDSEIEISELGSGTVEGSWSSAPSGTLIVRGIDKLTFDMSRNEDGCMPYTIGDKGGIACVAPFDP